MAPPTCERRLASGQPPPPRVPPPPTSPIPPTAGAFAPPPAGYVWQDGRLVRDHWREIDRTIDKAVFWYFIARNPFLFLAMVAAPALFLFILIGGLVSMATGSGPQY